MKKKTQLMIYGSKSLYVFQREVNEKLAEGWTVVPGSQAMHTSYTISQHGQNYEQFHAFVVLEKEVAD